MLNNNRNNNRCAKKGRYISSLLSLRSLLTRGAAFALLAGIGSSCSQSMDEEAMTRTGAPMTVTATMQGVGKPAVAVSEVVSFSGTGLPFTRTTTTDDATAGVYTAAWQKGDVVNVTFHCYSDADGTAEIAASQMPNGNTQMLTYDGTAWMASPSSLRLPVDVYSVKAVYTYSRIYTAADDTFIDATTIRALINRGTEQIAGQSTLVIPDDITKAGIAITPAADKWQRQTALVRLISLALGQSARVTTGGGESTLVSCPTVQTADPTQPANGVLTATVYLHQPVDDPVTPATVTTVTVDGVNGVVKPAFHAVAGCLYSVYMPALLAQQGVGDEDGGQSYTTWRGTYAQFYNNGAGIANLDKYTDWIIDLSAESDKITAVSFIRGKANARTIALNVTLTGIETLPDYAFYNCAKLAGITLPVTTIIGRDAFNNCAALTSVSLPVATSIGDESFAFCMALTNISLPAATSIGRSVFYSSSALSSVDLPAATSFGEIVFAGTCLNTLKLTAAGAMTLDTGVFNNYDHSGICTLYLNTDKLIGSGTPKPSGLTWYGQTWKAIQYE